MGSGIKGGKRVVLDIKSYTRVIDFLTMTEINKLLFISNIGEYFDLGDMLYVGCRDGKVLAVEVFRLEELNGELLPRFIHIIFHPDIQRSKSALEFLIKNEKDIARYGYRYIWSYILRDKCNMLNLSIKFGFNKISENEYGVTMRKNICQS